MIPAQVLKDIRRIQLSTARLVTGAMAGRYQSVFKGRGIEFEEVRPYQPGDDFRSIDWNVTARAGRPFVKTFVEERELTVLFLIDLSASCLIGTVQRTKRRLAAELCALLALSALRNNDRTGLLLFTDRVERVIPPAKGMRHVLRLIRDALYFDPRGRRTRVAAALEYLHRVFRRRAVVFLLSDFFDSGLEKPLAAAARQHDLIAVTLTDPLEQQVPSLGLARFRDAETGEGFLIDTSDPSFREAYSKRTRDRQTERKSLFYSARVDHIDLRTDAPYLPPLLAFFRTRERRIGRC